MIRALLILLALALPAKAEDLVAGLSQSRISISANFDGSEILIFGAVKRDSPIPEGQLGIIVTVEGPKTPLTVRRKDKQALIWVNSAAVEIDRAPSFYAVNTSGPLEQVLKQTSDMRHSITVRRAIRSVGAPMDIQDPTNFTDALIRIREAQGLYQQNVGAVEIEDQTLFNTSVALPANLVEGDYTSRIYLTREGQVIAEYASSIDVAKVGLERFLFTLAHDQPLAYGLLSLAIAIAAGWGASAVFRYLQG
ncbi:TIGR02186 family protein [Maribius pontilimi]|uniref:TIGR02186 family protein n=1 Tax=Palleronia pontilimi TaxID=1964209 RepID=A0A934IJ92_9RHOB|nr:TIGR02186 family protein [Palleronia pontilimi]